MMFQQTLAKSGDDNDHDNENDNLHTAHFTFLFLFNYARAQYTLVFVVERQLNDSANRTLHLCLNGLYGVWELLGILQIAVHTLKMQFATVE